MNKKISLLLPLLAMTATSCGGNPSISVAPDQFFEVASPDGSLKVNLTLRYGKLYYSVKKGSDDIVLDSLLSMGTSANDFLALSYVDSVKHSDVSLKYDNFSGKVKKVDTTYNEIILTFRENSCYFDVTFRLFDDGYGFRYGIRDVNDAIKDVGWTSEGTEIRIPDKAYTYSMKYVDNTDPDSPDEIYYSYEGNYDEIRFDRIADNAYVYPLLYRLDLDKDLYSLINEADLMGSGYHGSMLKKNENGAFQLIHAKACGNNPGKSLTLPFESPWRVGSVGTLAEVVESNIYENIYGNVELYKPENYGSLSKEEQKTFDYEWVTPGAGVWNFLSHGASKQSDLVFQKDYVDLCIKMGWKWLTLDADWILGLNVNKFREFTSYAHDNGIKIIVWANSFSDFSNRSVTQITLDNWKYYGIDGVKIDFFDGMYNDDISSKSKMESKETIEMYEAFYQEAAKREMVVDCHGSNKPTGERRVYPNVFNREAIQGAEFRNRLNGDQDTLLSLTRCVVGPSDYTPATMPFKNNLTLCHNMAQAVNFETGNPTFSGEIEEYYKNGEITQVGQFYKDFPSFWDETRLVEANLDIYNLSSVIARRSNTTWYVGGFAGNNGGNVQMDFSFLGEGSYNAKIYKDGATKNDMIYAEDVVDSSSSKTFTCLGSGGFAMILEPVK